MSNDSDGCIATVDRKGVPYNARLRRLRESVRMSPEGVAAGLGISAQEYYEWEAFASELTAVVSLRELSMLSSVLGVHSENIFEDGPVEGPRQPPLQLCAKITSHLAANAMTIDEFEERVGFVIGPCLHDPSEVMKWNVDCLRFVCKEISVDWRAALP